MAKLVMGNLPEGMAGVKGFAFNLAGVWYAYANENEIGRLLIEVLTTVEPVCFIN
jgi:hypothetical protein